MGKRSAGALKLFPAVRWALLLFFTLFLAWSLIKPESSGALGLAFHDGLVELLGASAYLLVPLLFYALWTILRPTRKSSPILTSSSAVLGLASSCALLSLLGRRTRHTQWGGGLGDGLSNVTQSVVGEPGAFLLWLGGAGLSLYILLDIPWAQWLSKGARLLLEDYRNWRQNRLELKELIRQAAQKQHTEIPFPSVERDALTESESRTSKSRPSRVKTAVNSAKSESSPNGYRLPPLDLLQHKRGDSQGRPSDGEIREAVENLERTLASFEIQARVSGISPGPVITRYEVSPAPGQTVSSIVARANDIALAMRAKGIRMIAPIPGKAAIGIEIPNQQPATVTLREVLESALGDSTSPLAFALGLNSDGTPLAADLQSMPHLLVAGATNSGKSVLVHSLIASILFRRRPDEVKLLLIDPKRIELTLYEGIPHLYDPKTPANEVQVLTHAKQAAASLKALVRVMEKRYEKFQEYRVRDIVAFNREALRRREAPEFFIVVVIDELADLMVIARDVVEDSIQRLTQMARAVGIHLVLATQRPSVDVITGVIKANLPSRIALRVASKIDSKVILDITGAEALLGKGDMLYLSPGQDPARIQGCFVSTQEIAALVENLKSQASPQYPLLETMSAVGEADLTQFGVEPLEFTQSLKLVLERRRVSQDLLKSQFGSSARATNLLSLLEVKGFIHKPEGSNRWEIHFDKIENYLSTNFPQIRLDKPGI